MKSCIVITIIILVLFSSCGNYPCGKASAIISLISFSDAETDTVILRRFSKGTNFISLTDSLILTRLNSNFQRQHDTLLLLHGNPTGYNDITSDYDYQVFIPRVNRLFKLTEVAEEIHYGRKSGPKIYCINPVTSYKLNGVTGVPVYNIIYLPK